MVGIQLTRGDIDTQTGVICHEVTSQINNAMAMKLFLDRFTSQDLATQFGFTVAEADIIKSAFGQMATINTVFQANRVFINQLAGMGDIS